MNNIKIGADPELWMVDNWDKPVIPHAYIPGTKASPYAIPELPGFNVLVDGFAVEFNIPPANTRTEFRDSIKTAVDFIQSKLPDNFRLLAVPDAEFDKDEFDMVPDFLKQVGCDRDYSAFTRAINPIPVFNNIRVAGGHIHIGWGENLKGHFDQCCEVVASLDAHWEEPDTYRRKVVPAGSFREKSYGVEWRTPSNLWLSNPGDIYDYTMDSIQRMVG